MKNCRICKTT